MNSSGNTPNAQLPSTEMGDGSIAHKLWLDALLNADALALETFLTDDWTLHNPYGGVSTKAEEIDNLRSGRVKYLSITDETPLVRLHGVTSIVTGKADIQFQLQEGEPMLVKVYYTAVYGWATSHWRMLAWQSTTRSDT
jgi:ketosteroid isomerase-like protein